MHNFLARLRHDAMLPDPIGFANLDKAQQCGHKEFNATAAQQQSG